MSPLFEDPSLYRSVLENLPIGIYVLDRQQRVRFWNRGAEQITGYLAQEVTGNICSESLPHCDPQGRMLAGDQCPITTTFGDGRPVHNQVFTLHKEGHRLAIQVRTLPFLDDNGVTVGVAVAFEEAAISSIPDFSAAPMYGCLDPVTGVPSQRLTRAILWESLAELDRTHGSFGLLHIRIMGLKSISVRYGTDSIAAFLRTSAQTIRHNLSAKDFFGRWSDDDFLAILHTASPIKIAALADVISRQVSESEIAWWGDRFPIQADIGYVVAGHGDKPETLLSRMHRTHAADAAKAGGATGSAAPRG